MVAVVLAEMGRRGIATRSDYQHLAWNQDSVCKFMQPFKAVASAIPDNQRTAYTEAGGRKIGRSKENPERVWIDTYSAIKTPKINAVMVCYVKRPGDEPEFKLYINGKCTQTYSADGLRDALSAWRKISEQAVD